MLMHVVKKAKAASFVLLTFHKTGNFLSLFFFFILNSLGFSHVDGEEGRSSMVWDDLWLQGWLTFWRSLQEEPPEHASCNRLSFRETH